ncbi:MAG: hypothetical protein KA744_13915 [Phenylobacterium sp.]|nr:hypothetical protein [Phenylobacterium sp.]
MAASTTVFSTTPLAGMKLSDKGSTAPQGLGLLTRVAGSNGHTFLFVKASEAIGSITTCIIGAAGSASSDAGSAGWTANVPGGATTGQYFWVQRTTLA